MSVDDSLRDRFEAMKRSRDESRTARDEPLMPLEVGGGGGDSGGMDGLNERVTRVELRLDAVEHRLGALEGRLDRLDSRFESRMDGLDTRLRTLEQSVASVSAKLDILTTQIVAKLPSWWQMPAVIGATVALLAGLWAVARWLGTRGWL